MSFETNWDVNSYRTDYESDEHWRLRKKFMETHKEKFPQDELVCLAQVFVNIEFLGCKYPAETMHLVGELSQDVAKEFRQERSKRLKRTFVKASDAAEARAKGCNKPASKGSISKTNKKLETNKSIDTGNEPSSDETSTKALCNQFKHGTKLNVTKNQKSDSKESGKNLKQKSKSPPQQQATQKPNTSSSNKRKEKLDENETTNPLKSSEASEDVEVVYKFVRPSFQLHPTRSKYTSKMKESDLFTKLPFGQFVLIQVGGRNCIQISGQRAGIHVGEKEFVENNERKFDILLNGKVIGSGKSPAIKEAKTEAFNAAIKHLQENCFTITPKQEPDRINISKNNSTVTCNLQTCEDQKLDSNNIGYKIMQKLGWTGGGLGLREEKGRENPVGFLIKNNRRGLGNSSGDINGKYFQDLLKNYIQSEDIRDLYFESSFTKDERASLHKVASAKNLKSSSHGKEPNRHLIISKKNITPQQIVYEVLVNRNPMYINKYEVTIPKQKLSLFPDHGIENSNFLI